MAVSTVGEMTCSQRPASTWASAHDSPSRSVRKRSARRWRRTTLSASDMPRLGEADGAGVDGDEVGLLHAADHLGHGRARDLEPLGDAGLDDLDVVLAQLEDGLAVLLEGRVPFPRLMRCHGRGVYGVSTPRGLRVNERSPVGSLHGVTAPDPLDRFSAPVRAWFSTTFAEATAAAGPGLAGHRVGRPHPVLAPTGSGKTLAAFLWGLDRLVTDAAARRRASTAPGCSTSRRCGRWPSTSRRTCGPRSPASASPPSAWASRSTRRSSACAPATPPPTSAAACCATRPTCSSPRPSRST